MTYFVYYTLSFAYFISYLLVYSYACVRSILICCSRISLPPYFSPVFSLPLHCSIGVLTPEADPLGCHPSPLSLISPLSLSLLSPHLWSLLSPHLWSLLSAGRYRRVPSRGSRKSERDGAPRGAEPRGETGDTRELRPAFLMCHVVHTPPWNVEGTSWGSERDRKVRR